MVDATGDMHTKALAFIGSDGAPIAARDPVNLAQIRQWCDAFGDTNPNYTDSTHAARSGHGHVVAPPAMLSSWTSVGGGTAIEPADETFRLLDAAGYTGTALAFLEQSYVRYLTLDELVTRSRRVVELSGEQQGAQGLGCSVTVETSYRTERGEPVGTTTERLFKYRPAGQPTAAGAASLTAAGPAGERPKRPRPGMNQDTRFFWDGLRAGELRIQRCSDCEALEHPPTVRCLACGSSNRGYIVASGKASPL